MTYFSEDQMGAVRELLNQFLTEPLSLEDLMRLLGEEPCEGCVPAIRSRKKRYVIAVINAMAEDIDDPRHAYAFRRTTASAFGIGADLLRTESAKIVRHSKTKDAVNEKIYDLMDEVRDCLFR